VLFDERRGPETTGDASSRRETRVRRATPNAAFRASFAVLKFPAHVWILVDSNRAEQSRVQVERISRKVPLRTSPRANLPKMEGQPGEGPQSTADLSAFVQNLLSQMQSRFQQMSDSIITRIDEMGERIDDLEKSVGDLVQQAEDDVNAPAPEGAVTPAK
jgi:heat shock factor-binding protein 1